MKRASRIVIASALAFVFLLGTLAFTYSDRYFEIAKNMEIYASIYKEINSSYVDEVNPNLLMKEGIDAMLESLDPYTTYIPEDDIEDYRTQMTGLYGGIGSVIANHNGRIVIAMPYENFPAQKAGLKIGDEIIEVDGVKMTDKDVSDVSKMLRGQEGTNVKVVIRRVGLEKPLEVTLTREKIKINNVPYHGMINENVGYIKLTDFTENASREVKTALLELKEKGAKYVVFDLRGNPGGLLKEAVNISNIFIPKDKPVVITKGRVADANKTYYALNAATDLEIPVVVLINGRSASASEIVSGVMQDYDRAVIIGQRSFGKGLVQTTKPVAYNSQLKFTFSKYFTPSGRCIQAIDYSHKDKEGKAGVVADSLLKAFKTSNGRVVYDGRGITPDIEVVHDTLPEVAYTLISKFLLFDYATLYVSKHATIADAKSFAITDAEYIDFANWLKDKQYDYTTRVEKQLMELEKTAKHEGYYEAIKDKLELLKEQMAKNKEKDLFTFKSQIRELLEEEIVSRYYLQKGMIEASFDSDKDVQSSLQLFADLDRYRKILSGK